MFRLVAVLVLLALVWLGMAWIKNLPPGKQRRLALRVAFGALMVALVFLALTGRIHWVGAVLGALIPFARTLIALVPKLLPFWHQHKARQSEREHARESSTGGAMSLEEALSTLGLSQAYRDGSLDSDQVHKAHKRLIQKLHPDRGGNDYLASKINEAKARVLKQLH